MPKREECLVDLERMTIAAAVLLEDVIAPVFGCMKLDNVLEEISKSEGCSREAAALSWMEDHYDELQAAIFAVRAIVEVLEP